MQLLATPLFPLREWSSALAPAKHAAPSASLARQTPSSSTQRVRWRRQLRPAFAAAPLRSRSRRQRCQLGGCRSCCCAGGASHQLGAHWRPWLRQEQHLPPLGCGGVPLQPAQPGRAHTVRLVGLHWAQMADTGAGTKAVGQSARLSRPEVRKLSETPGERVLTSLLTQAGPDSGTWSSPPFRKPPRCRSGRWWTPAAAR